MLANVLEQLSAAGYRVTLNDRGDGLRGAPAEARTPAVDDLLRANKPALVAALAAVRADQPRIAALLRAFRGLDVTIARGRSPGKFKVSDPSKVTPALVAEVKALTGPLDTYLLTREHFGPLEIAWRAEAMGRQVQKWQAAHSGDERNQLPFLVARTIRDVEWPLFTHCFSCGDPLANDPGWDGALAYHEPYFAEFLRCSDCRAAIWKVQEESGGMECRCFCGGEVHRFTAGGEPLCEAHAQPVCLTCRTRPHQPDRWLVAPGDVERYQLCPFCGAEGNHRVEVRGEERAA